LNTFLISHEKFNFIEAFALSGSVGDRRPAIKLI